MARLGAAPLKTFSIGFEDERFNELPHAAEIARHPLIGIDPNDPYGRIMANIFKEHALAYDVAVCLNAWCFESDGSFNVTKARALLEACAAHGLTQLVFSSTAAVYGMPATGRAAEKGLTSAVDFRLLDYRDLDETFDRIVSVGMFEHVGVGYYDTFFEKAAGLLNDKGVMLLHTIGRSEGPNVTNPWIAKYIFPGGYIPALSEVMPAIEKSGLLVTDIEILRLHYAETLAEWTRRFRANRDAIKKLYDERFCRMWEFYLTGSELSFRYGGQMVFQMQLAKQVDAVPLTTIVPSVMEVAEAIPATMVTP